jgi:DNA-binding transcriptional LysR family regulator
MIVIREFKTFIAVAKAGTFRAAGQRLGLTQSAVSAQIKRLEAYLGAELFERSPRAAVLNAMGRHMLIQAQEVVTLVDRMAMHAGGAPVTGSLRVGAIASVQQGLLVQALGAFRREFPDVTVRIVPGVSLSLLGQVDVGEVDLAVLIRPPFALPADLGWQTLVNEPFRLAVAESLPLMPWRELLSQQPFIRYERSSFGGRQVDAFLRKQRISVHEAIELDEIDAIANLARNGLGVALLPEAGRLDLKGLRMLDLGTATFYREIGIVSRQPDDEQGVAGRMASCLKASIPVRNES